MAFNVGLGSGPSRTSTLTMTHMGITEEVAYDVLTEATASTTLTSCGLGHSGNDDDRDFVAAGAVHTLLTVYTTLTELTESILAATSTATQKARPSQRLCAASPTSRNWTSRATP